MLTALFRKNSSKTPAQQIYGTVMAQARTPRFFSDLDVPDTVMGRFDMLSLHVYLIARRLRGEQTDSAVRLSQEVFDLYVADVERALRELGIGDTSVPKRKKKMIRSFYGQIEDFDQPMDERDHKTLSRRVAKRFLDRDSGVGAKAIADYMLKTNDRLREQMLSNIIDHGPDWLPLEEVEA